jgi:hypothetical protein
MGLLVWSRIEQDISENHSILDANLLKGKIAGIEGLNYAVPILCNIRNF